MVKLRLTPHRTNPLIWLVAIICAILTFAVIVVGLVTFIGYMVTRPTIPSITVVYAHLDALLYDQSGDLTTQITLTMSAENHNTHAHASFSNLRFLLQFHGMTIADLRADPFDVPKNDSEILAYNIPSSPIPLDSIAMDAMNRALQRNIIPFDLTGSARTRWKIGVIGSVKFWTHMSCKLQFIPPPNGSSINTYCSTKSH